MISISHKLLLQCFQKSELVDFLLDNLVFRKQSSFDRETYILVKDDLFKVFSRNLERYHSNKTLYSL